MIKLFVTSKDGERLDYRVINAKSFSYRGQSKILEITLEDEEMFFIQEVVSFQTR